MLELMANKMSVYFAENGLIDKGEKEVYSYLGQMLLLKVFNISLIFFIGFIMQRPIESMMAFLCMTEIRKYSGGYHADTPGKCMLITNGSIILLNLWIPLIPLSTVWWLAGMFFMSAVIIFLSPIEDVKRPLEESERIRFKNKTRNRIVCINIIVAVLWFFAPVLLKYLIYIIFSIYIIGLACVIGHFCSRTQ